MKTRRFDFNFRPLQINIAVSAVGSVPARQDYNADADEYTPDYTLTPLIIQPSIGRLDKDEILQSGSVNNVLANIKWYEILNGTRTLIQAANTNYEITTSGDQAGRIKLKKNVQPQNPLTLEFNADYTDIRTNQIIKIVKTFPVICANSTTYIPQLLLDANDQTIYNPLRDTATQVVHASLKLGENECPTAKRIFVWEVYREDGTWTTVGSDNVLDYPLSVSGDGASCTVDRSLMGEDLYLRCRAKYDPDGNPSGVTLTDAAPSKIVGFVRRIAKFEYDMAGVPVNIPAGLLAISPEAKVWDTAGEILTPEANLLILWYSATNRASGSLSYTQIGHGPNPVLPTGAMSDTLGGVFGMDVKDAGPTAIWEDSDGYVIEDSDGALLLVK